jgi:hypothetical protein
MVEFGVPFSPPGFGWDSLFLHVAVEINQSTGKQEEEENENDTNCARVCF